MDLVPEPDDARLTRAVEGYDDQGKAVTIRVVVERALTLYVNGTEVVTLMTIGDHPELLALGFLLNQNMLAEDDEVTAIDYDDDLGVIVVRTRKQSSYEQKLSRRVRTSGCAQGTVFGDIMERFDDVQLNQNLRLKTSALSSMLKKINSQPSLYSEAGAIHGCVLCDSEQPRVYMEDVGRHNAVDKIAGYMHRHSILGHDKIFYTTGRLTSEMVIKTVQMEIPILVSRSGFTESGVSLARQAGLTLIGRAKSQRFIVLSGEHRIERDLKPGNARANDGRGVRGGIKAQS